MYTMRTYRADLHVHSSHSNKPTYWAMRKFNCPESYTSPLHIYKTARERGMDFVTISDHNVISGALEIAHLPGVFISCEVTAYFPENGCKVHVVVLDINESQFRDINELRRNIHELVPYLHSSGIAHFLAHPLYAQNDKLTLDIIEKSLLLFTAIEVKNGCRANRFNSFTRQLVSSLDEPLINRLANRHNQQPYGLTPWIKAMVAGSDDHGGLFIARAYTSAAGDGSIRSFINAIKYGHCLDEGLDGGPLTMAHSLYGISYSFYKERFSGKKRLNAPFVNALLNRFFDLGDSKASLVEKLRLFVLKNLPPSGKTSDLSFEALLDREARLLLNDSDFLASISDAGQNTKIFAVTSRLANSLLFHYTNRLMALPLTAGFFDYLNTAGTIGLIHTLIAPYYLAFHHQHKGKELIREVSRLLPENARPEEREKIALFTDTLDEINGVAITINRLIKTAREQDAELTVITSGGQEGINIPGVVRFKPVGNFSLPEYPDLKLSFPPVLDIMDFIEREGFSRIHISTPGTVGLLGLLIARLMNIPVDGTYHTDIPQYVRSLTNDDFLEQAAWSYMTWFYSQMEDVLVPSSGTRRQLLSRGLAQEKLKPLPRWVDTDMFSPDKRNDLFWKQRGLKATCVLLYVGRVSREKSMDLLADVFRQLVDEGSRISLAIIGDGPYRNEMETQLAGYPVHFTGFLSGDELSEGFASADLFVFPSATDTFGNVVLEAQACGLPVIVSDQGGPRELMLDGETGVVFKAGSHRELAEAIRYAIANPLQLALMGQAARHFTVNRAPATQSTLQTVLHMNQTTETTGDCLAA